jgi:hypothetical protein
MRPNAKPYPATEKKSGQMGAGVKKKNRKYRRMPPIRAIWIEC